MPDSGHEPTPRELAMQIAYQNESIESFRRELAQRLAFYSELSKQTAHFVTDEHFSKVVERVEKLELAKSNLEGRFWAVTAIVVLIELALVVWELMVRR